MNLIKSTDDTRLDTLTLLETEIPEGHQGSDKIAIEWIEHMLKMTYKFHDYIPPMISNDSMTAGCKVISIRLREMTESDKFKSRIRYLMDQCEIYKP